MATDVARLSFDPARLYRGVVPQQGRVSLEAEQNEQRVIDDEERRKEIIDIVGPAGTPDNGYAVSKGQGPGFDLSIGHGTMYVGGWRVELDSDMDTAKQPDWLDTLQIENPVRPTREHIILWLQDTDVTAVEDPALYEVALGGPDGAARTRLLQRVKRLPTTAGTCADAAQQEHETWAQQGLSFDPGTMELQSQSRLQVTWEPGSAQTDPCAPASTGGYLGAENQCIRVQITDVHADGTFNLLWGYDDASFLYRVTADKSVNPGPVLTLEQTPVDDYHRLRAGQAVQALRAAAQLTTTNGAIEGYVAALGGVPAVLSAPYDPDTKTVQFPQPLGSEYTDPAINPQLYLRVWEEWLQNQQLNKPIALTGTGMQITITVAGNANLHLDDFWCIGVRPATPTAVYPDRYLKPAQPPDGPHLWICPLAVISWENETFAVLEDCRNHFKPLIDVECCDCCTINVRPSDAANLQQLVNNAVAGRATQSADGRLTVCFQPGRYELTAPLVLFDTGNFNFDNVTLCACHDAAVLAVAAGHEAAFGLGMVLLINVNNVTITGFEFDMPQVTTAIPPAQTRTGALLTPEAVRAASAAVTPNLAGSIAILLASCTAIEIDRCVFGFNGEAATQTVLGTALMGLGPISGLRLHRNRFSLGTVTANVAGAPLLLTGFAHQFALPNTDGSMLPATLDNAVITDNEFGGITGAILVNAQLGRVRVADNLITECYFGVWIVDAVASANTDFGTRQVAAPIADAVGQTQNGLARSLFDPVLLRLQVLAALYPLPLPGGAQPKGIVHRDVAQLPTLRQQAAVAQSAYMTQFDQHFAAGHPASVAADVQKAADAQTAKTVQVSGTAGLTVDQNLLTVAAGLAELASVAGFTQIDTKSLTIESNLINCIVPGLQTSGPALFAYLALAGTQFGGCSTVAVDTNRLVSESQSYTAVVAGGVAGTINGNTVFSGTGGALLAAAGFTKNGTTYVAIVGNFIAGVATLPTRPQPLPDWTALNTVV
ncbi:DUF6519 domain-containing protein [Mycobacterium sp.]|uniref:DUF6519 domain-containing protein n=1 Tax=Mycobacterium sp. TaxID=1785 RepID=UPI003F9B68A8